MGGIIFSFILFAISSYFFVQSVTMEDLRDVDPIGASGIPNIVLFCLVVLTLYTLVSEIIKYKKVKRPEQNDVQKKTLSKPFIINLSIVVSIGVFILLLNKTGFFIGCLVLTPILLICLGAKNKIQIVLVSVGVPIFFSFLFGNILSIPIPKGVGIFSEISSILY
ncbi:tripartite tricarboxylate transporter TctB family protein [Mammaliicoccus sp. Dog046]|uniref:tripartite tricarboxylate transporter TctB family protein n=1 Tax=Mammaliicoccus sp. Dog046 TaxID=3034233 RepID=UPI002B261F35|nr:tripartite tricarboxylate transporter TctB family protein [Mammaliicoccus sp. Dog046]WQK85608.1 tripartite tricarboxylate transporter TctB family protein [Mammaliicoccus sp. Dog046]